MYWLMHEARMKHPLPDYNMMTSLVNPYDYGCQKYKLGAYFISCLSEFQPIKVQSSFFPNILVCGPWSDGLESSQKAADLKSQHQADDDRQIV